MKAKECELVMNTRNGHVCHPIKFGSIAEAVRYARDETGGFRFRVFVKDVLLPVRQGFCG